MGKIENYFVTKDFQSKFNVSSSTSETQENNLEKIKEDNEDIVGWISIPDTDINFPIVQADDNEFYKNHNLNRKTNDNGTIFMDYRNNTTETNQNYVVYGNDLFSDLTAYKYQDFYDDHKEITFVTDSGMYRAFVFSVFEVHKDKASQITTWNSLEERQRYIDSSLERSYILSDLLILDDENILTLTTTTDWSDEVMITVQAVIMNPNENGPSESILENKMSVN